MKKFTLTMLAAMGIWLAMAASSNAGVHFGIYLGAPGFYVPGCYGPRFCLPAPVIYFGPGCDYGYPGYYRNYYSGYGYHHRVYHGHYYGH